MMRYLIIFFLLINCNAFGQDYGQSFAKYLTEYKQDFIENPNSPLKKKDLKDLQFFNPDSTYRVKAKIELLQNEKAIKIPTSSGDSKKFFRHAKAIFNLNGKTVVLTLYRNEIPSTDPKYRDFLFLPFTDETNGKTTYGGGRYIDINKNEIKDNWLEIDFNKAYNPYCAYSHGYHCPIPPEENDLPLEINAGEKLFSGKIRN